MRPRARGARLVPRSFRRVRRHKSVEGVSSPEVQRQWTLQSRHSREDMRREETWDPIDEDRASHVYDCGHSSMLELNMLPFLRPTQNQHVFLFCSPLRPRFSRHGTLVLDGGYVVDFRSSTSTRATCASLAPRTGDAQALALKLARLGEFQRDAILPKVQCSTSHETSENRGLSCGGTPEGFGCEFPRPPAFGERFNPDPEISEDVSSNTPPEPDLREPCAFKTRPVGWKYRPGEHVAYSRTTPHLR